MCGVGGGSRQREVDRLANVGQGSEWGGVGGWVGEWGEGGDGAEVVGEWGVVAVLGGWSEQAWGVGSADMRRE